MIQDRGMDMEDSLVTVRGVDRNLQDEDVQENILRPKFLSDFQGQEDLKENLSIFVKAALSRQESLDHIFISGPPGLGKTTLSSIVANEMHTTIRSTSAPVLDKPKDLAGILTNVSEGSILFIDEIHRLKPVLEEMLYVAMEDFEIDWVIGNGPAARTMRIPIPHFTLIGATTKAGAVSAPLANRFGINFHIDLYPPEELSKIIERSAKILGIEITEDAVHLLSECSRGTPRIANRLLRRLRDYADVLTNGSVDIETAEEGLGRMGIDRNGLDKMDRRILSSIIENYDGGPVGLETLAISVDESVESIEDKYEPYLIQQGYLKRTARGRCVTGKAMKLLGYKTNENQGLLF